jgi:4-hydroxy-tetrahydrodipicolinate reductase
MSQRTHHLAVLGASGTMGRLVLEQAEHSTIFTTVTGIVRTGSEHDKGTLHGAVLSSDMDASLKNADVLIDFSTPGVLAKAIPFAQKHKVASVIGTTGLSARETKALDALSQHAPVLVSSNFSLGVNLLFELAEYAARALTEGFDLEVSEAHHRRKLDAPSGTALSLGRALAKGRGVDFEKVASTDRQQKLEARRLGDIGFSSIRGGDIAGEHTAFLIGDHEQLELTHRAKDRGIFAGGALKSALFLAGQSAGMYSMRDVLGMGR